MIRVLIVDDHPVLRMGLAAVLGTYDDVEVVGDTGDPSAVLTLAAELRPDVVVLDLGLGTANGVDLIPRLSETSRVLVFTATGAERAVIGALDAGATGFLLKDASHGDLVAGIRSAASGTAVLSPVVAARVLERVQRPDQVLTRRELDVLELLAEGLTNRAIAARLHMSESTVKTHLIRVFVKLDVDGRAGAVAEASRRGLIALGG